MSGYIGNIPVPQATQTRDTFTATASQTTFATSGYTPSFLDVFLNGVHLVNGTDYTATNGSDVVLTSGAAAGDTLEVVAYSTYQVNSQNYTGGLTVDNDGATVLTVDRATSDGTIIDFQKDGSSVGSIYNGGGNLGVNSSGGLLLIDDIITPTSGADATHDIGRPSARYKNLYLSGGVYLGGTGAANYLDDYEEGTWTPTLVATGTAFSSVTYGAFQSGAYTKIGNQVTVRGIITATATSGGSAALAIGNLPFASSREAAGTLGYISGLNYDDTVYNQIGLYITNSGGSRLIFTRSGDNTPAQEVGIGEFTSDFGCVFTATYVV